MHSRHEVSAPAPLKPSASINAHCCLATIPCSMPVSSTSACFQLPISGLPSPPRTSPSLTQHPSRHATHHILHPCLSINARHCTKRTDCRGVGVKMALLNRCYRRNRDDQQTTTQRRPTQSVKFKTNENIPQGPQHNNINPKGKKTPHRRAKLMEATKRQRKYPNDATATGQRVPLPKLRSQHSNAERKKE